MPPWERAVDSISLGLHKHDSTRGKVDPGDLPTRQGYTSPWIPALQGPGQRRPVGPPERMAFDNSGDEVCVTHLSFDGRVCKMTQMLDNSRGQLGQQGENLVADAGPQKSGV